MTISELKNYTKRKQEINDIQKELDSNHYATDVVTTCTSPSYVQHRKVIGGYMPDDETVKLLERINSLKKRQRACERYVENIEDYQTRKMFALHFIVGKTFVQTAIECGLGGREDCVKKRIYRYIQKN